MKFFNPFDEIRVTRHNLPHWQQPGAAYFVTWRMADSIPVEVLREWEAERDVWLLYHQLPLSEEDEAEFHRLFSSRIDRYLDDGHGSCVLRRPELREIISESFGFFEGVRYEQLSRVIMPNHVHTCFVLHPDWLLEKVLYSWKRRTSGVINERFGTSGQFWQHDYFDRLIRDGQHLRNVIRYIRRNPGKARLREGEYTLWESELARSVE